MSSPLDPQDWTETRAQMHRLLDACLDRLQNAADHPWQEAPQGTVEALQIAGKASTEAAVFDRAISEIMPYSTGNTHPRFWGWVHGTGLVSGVAGEMIAASMNCNNGGRNHIGNLVERAVIEWSRKVMGFPETASGILVSGTSQATVIALSAARIRALGADVRAAGMGGARLRAYAGAGVHNATRKAIELLGIGHDNLVKIPEGPNALDLDALRSAVAADRAAGYRPFAVVGTAGSVDLGLFDDFHSLADIAQAENLWLHIDGAFGAWTRLADAPWRELTDGIERADSLACDFHKWMYMPYDCGLCLIKDEAEHRAAFAARPSYLAAAEAGLAGGDPWYCDYGIDLSRGNRAMKVWTALSVHGEDAFGEAITENLRLTACMGELVAASGMRLMRPVVSNLCVFSAAPDLPPEAQSKLNADIAVALQSDGTAVFSTTIIDGITCLRAAIVNHRTTKADIGAAIDAIATITQNLPKRAEI